MNEEQNIPGEDILQPVEITVTASPKTQPVDIEVPFGHVYIVALDTGGAEIEGSGFFYPEKSYRRFYADESKFLVKKKL